MSETEKKIIKFDLGHPLNIEVSSFTLWFIVYVGPTIAGRTVGLQVNYLNGGIQTSYTLNLGIDQVFYFEPLKCMVKLIQVHPRYESITLEKIEEVKKQ